METRQLEGLTVKVSFMIKDRSSAFAFMTRKEKFYPHSLIDSLHLMVSKETLAFARRIIDTLAGVTVVQHF